jgi:hypothetical protein
MVNFRKFAGYSPVALFGQDCGSCALIPAEPNRSPTQ